MKNVLVTGGAGFIGGHLVDKLVSMGKNVFVIDNESSSSVDGYHYNSKATYFKIDITDFNKLEFIFRDRPSLEIDTIFHLAALSRIPYSIENPIKACNTNFNGTLNVLEVARIHKVDRVIFSSTSAAYGNNNQPPLQEAMTPEGLNPYSVSKLGAENLCKMYYSLYGLKTIMFRYFNVYGPREPKKGDYAPVMGIFRRQKSNRQPMTVVGDGLQTRDFTHVDDVVQANILASESNDESVFGELFNVGSGLNYSILDICTMIGGYFTHIPERKGELKHTLADISKIRKMLGYQPTIKLEDWINEENLKYGEKKK